jgi:phosphatidylserine decarboxylase
MSNLFVLLQYIAPQHLISRLAGKLANGTLFKNQLIRLFVRRYNVDLSESRFEDIHQFKNFNAFFTRELKPGARPAASVTGAILCPVDGSISEVGAISNDNLLQAKGRFFSLDALLGGDSKLAAQFQEGCFATVYLSPRDYHRVHMPLGGRLQKMIYIPGKLFSVNQATTRSIPSLFARNERVVCLFETDAGPMAVILVGAMIVAGIETIWSGQVCPTAGTRAIRTTDYSEHSPPIEIAGGSEMGRFKLGSTVIVLFGHGAITLETDLQAQTPVRMGQLLGRISGH